MKQESNLSITSVITDTKLDDIEVLLPVNHNHHNFWKQQIHLGQISPVETMSVAKKFSVLEIPQFFLRISGHCYGYCD